MSHLFNNQTRRNLLKGFSAAVAVTLTGGLFSGLTRWRSTAWAQKKSEGKPDADSGNCPNKKTADSLNYVADVTEIGDESAIEAKLKELKGKPTNETKLADQKCSNCQYYGLNPDKNAPEGKNTCALIAGCYVNANGWCKQWALKPNS